MFFYNEGDSGVSQQLPLITEGMVLELDAEDYAFSSFVYCKI